jgi:ERCC4-related helicase
MQGRKDAQIARVLRILTLREKLEEYSYAEFASSIADDGGRDLDAIRRIIASCPASNPKLETLCEIVKKQKSDSRAIVFCNYRQIVATIAKVLQSANINCSAFVGQARSGQCRGQSRQEQQRVMEQFRAGKISVLVATSVGEEGIDVGEVDLIVCYDIQKSVTRMVQRMGRTGRKRDGKIVFLVNMDSRNARALDEGFEQRVGRSIASWSSELVMTQSEVLNPNHLEIVSGRKGRKLKRSKGRN